MVLQTANSFKRVDNENTPPLYKPHGSNKQLVPHIRTAAHDAARRRRARTNGGAHSPRYAVEQARRRSATKSPTNSVRIDLSALPRTPSPDKDVGMQELSHSPASNSLPSTPINLPRYLARPDYREISKEAIAAVDPQLKDVTMDYILDGLEVLGPRFVLLLYSLSTLYSLYALQNANRAFERSSPTSPQHSTEGTRHPRQ